MWPAAVLARVRELHAAGLCDREVADRMRDVFLPGTAGNQQVGHLRGRRLGLPVNRDATRLTPGREARFRGLHALGLTARGLVERDPGLFGPGDRGVRAALAYARRLGLPLRPAPAVTRDEALRRFGPRFWRDHRRAEAAALAARWGLPAGLTVRQVQIVLALTAGPMSSRALFAACEPGAAGRHRCGWFRGQLRGACGTGLVVPVGANVARLYFLSDDCLTRLRAAAARRIAEGDAGGGD